MNKRFAGFENVWAYIDCLLVLKKTPLKITLSTLIVLKKIKEVGLKINTNKSFFAHKELEYLGYWITREGILPSKKKIEAILKITLPTNHKELCSFIGLVNYFCDMWKCMSEILEPLMELTSEKSKWTWNDKHQKAFEQMKKVLSREVLLAYPYFSKPFVVHTDASDYQLGGNTSQDGKPITFYLWKLNNAQTCYTTTEKNV